MPTPSDQCSRVIQKLTALLHAAQGLAAVLVGKPLFVFVAEQERQCFHSKLTRLRQVEKKRSVPTAA